MENTNSEVKNDQNDHQGLENGVVIQESAALNLLAQYTDSEDETKDITEKNQYREAESSDSSSSSSESDDEVYVKKIKEKLECSVSDEDSDNENDESTKERKKKPPLRVKGEFLLEDLPPIQDLEIEVDEKECLEIGTITSIVEQLVLVEGYPHSAPLDIDSVLFLNHGKKALGKIFDVIGQVSKPIYCIRFNTHDDIVSKNINTGEKVFCAPRTEYSSFVILSNIMGKGSDASWKNDVEIPENLIEYSDDEEEKKARRPRKKNQKTLHDRPMAVARSRFLPQNHSWHNQINQQQQMPYWVNQPQQPCFQNYSYYPQNPYNQ